MGILDLDEFELGDGKDRPPYKYFRELETQQGQLNWLAQAVSELNEVYTTTQFKYANPLDWGADTTYEKNTIVIYDTKAYVTFKGAASGEKPGESDSWDILSIGTQGIKGDKGEDGKAATIAVGTVTTGEAGTEASVTNSGTDSAAVFDFVIPQGKAGAKGADGIKGDKGEDGKAATIAVGTVTTGEAGTEASVTNSGTDSAAVFDFVIPQGKAGVGGNEPAWGSISVGTYSAETTYSKGEYVVATSEEDGVTSILLWVFESLADDNLGNPLPTNFVDTDYWKSVGRYPTQLMFLNSESLRDGGVVLVDPSLENGIQQLQVIPMSMLIATTKRPGFVQPGNGLSITSEGVLSVTASGGGIENKLLATMDLGVGDNGLFNCVVKIYTQYITITLTAAENATNQLSTTSIQKAIESWDMTSFDEDTRNLFTPQGGAQAYIGDSAFAFVTFDGVCIDSSYRDSYDYPIHGYFCDVGDAHTTLEIRVTGNSYYTADSTRTFYFPESQMNTRRWSQTFTFLNNNAIPTA